MNEGFFADVVVLVEGEDDRAAILADAGATGHDLESMGVPVIPCMGVDNLDKPVAIFKLLGLSLYLVWDNDRGNPNAKRRNHYLLRLCGQPEDDWPEVIGPEFACLEGNLETVLRSELGSDVFDTLLDACQQELSIRDRDQALKNPAVVQRVMELAAVQGKQSESVHGIVESILRLWEATRRP